MTPDCKSQALFSLAPICCCKAVISPVALLNLIFSLIDLSPSEARLLLDKFEYYFNLHSSTNHLAYRPYYSSLHLPRTQHYGTPSVYRPNHRSFWHNSPRPLLSRTAFVTLQLRPISSQVTQPAYFDIMPPLRTIPAAKPVKTERTHEENQERFVLAQYLSVVYRS